MNNYFYNLFFKFFFLNLQSDQKNTNNENLINAKDIVEALACVTHHLL